MKDTRKITVTGNGRSYSLTLPRWMIKELKWKKGQKVVFVLRGKEIVIRDGKGD